jgi:hypothetical protein
MTNHTSPEPTTGARATGTYFGVPFTGTIGIARRNTMNWASRITHIKLDEPTEINGSLRDGICLESTAPLGETDEYGCRLVVLP